MRSRDHPLAGCPRPRPGEALLDAGTGAGAVAAAALARGCAVVAIDPEADMLELARTAAPRAVLLQAALPSLPFAEGRFDTAVANFVLNHVPHAAEAARELHRVLRPGGRLGVSVWPSESRPLRDLWDEVVQDAGVCAAPRSPAGQFSTPDDLARLLGEAGLRVEDAWPHEFVHVVDPELWWSAVTRGVASIGQTFLAQDAGGRAAMRAAYARLSRRHLGTDGQLHLRGAAVLATATHP